MPYKRQRQRRVVYSGNSSYTRRRVLTFKTALWMQLQLDRNRDPNDSLVGEAERP